MIKKVKITNFRSLKDISIPFEEGMSVLVGENDCGKSSIIDAIKIVFNNENVVSDDFYHDTNEIIIDIEIEDRSIIKRFMKDGDSVSEQEILVKISRDLITKIYDEINSDSFEDLDKLKLFAKDLGVSFGGSIGLETLKTRINNKIEELNELDDDGLIIKGSIPEKVIYFLDGKHFENVEQFFRERFFKKKKSSIWSEKTESGVSIEDEIRSNLNDYSNSLTSDIEEKGITDRLRSYLPELDDISIKPLFEPKDIQIGLKVKLLEKDGNEINFDKKGDGTKRKITMALLEYGKDIIDDIEPIYIFDEPDTHLHVRSQIDLLNILRSFNEDGVQVVLTTHSPFILNSVEPRQVKLLINEGETKLIPINPDEKVEWGLQALGIENVNLFFSRKILIVEGETEEKFIPIIQKRFHGKYLNNIMVKLVNRKSITDIPRFAEILATFVKPADIYLLIDNDGGDETNDLIDNLPILEDNICRVGTKEFEDSFEPDVIYSAWKVFVENAGKEIGPEWTINKIRDLKEACINDGRKFSTQIRSLNSRCLVRLKKPSLGQALAENIEERDLDQKIKDLLDEIQ